MMSTESKREEAKLLYQKPVKHMVGSYTFFASAFIRSGTRCGQKRVQGRTLQH